MADPAKGSGEAGSSSTTGPLSNEVLLLAADHYDEHILEVLQNVGKILGASFTSEREACTTMIINAHSPKWEAEREHLKYLQTQFPHSPQLVIRSYHWLLLCGREQRAVEESELVDPVPFMVNPDEPHYPVKVWISKNIGRKAGESATDAHRNATRDLESVGAVPVEKRAHADVLIVDKNSKFYETVKREKQTHGRYWQKLAERDWIEYCLSSKTVALETRTLPNEEDAADSDGQDSFVEEEPRPVQTGPGRPTGKPRIEYSPEDDDFLCRWLAAFHPSGSWSSRKTFRSLAMDEGTYPIASRHSSQSWQERFKKNAGAFSRRIRRLVGEGVNETLKTNKERSEERIKKAKMAAGQPIGEPLVRAVDEPITDPSGTTEVSNDTAIGEPQQRPPQSSVDSTEPRAAAGSNDGNQQGEATVPVIPPDATVAAETVTTSVRQQTEVLVPETLAAPLEPVIAQQTIVTTTTTEAVAAESSTVDVTRHSTNATAVGNEQPLPAQALNDVSGAASSNQPETERAGEPSAVSEDQAIRIRPASELLGEATADPNPIQTPSPRRSSKKRRTSEIPSGSTPLRQELERSREKSRRLERQDHGSEQAGPTHRLSKRASSPDKVYAFVGLPPRKITPSIGSAGSTPAPEAANPIAAAPLTPEEHWQSIQRGTRLVQDVAAQYRAKITALCQKYKIGTKEISDATTEMRKKGNGGASGLDWDSLDQLLSAKFGRT